MLIDRPEVVEGSSIQNATVPSGAALPPSPNVGELFFLTSGAVGLYTYNGSAWDVAVQGATLLSHINDDTRHLTPAQNTLLDGITVDAATINTIPSVTSRVGTVETSLTNHIADDSRHLTVVQNTFLDGLDLPTLTSTEVNFLSGAASNVQSQINAVVAENSSQNTSIASIQAAQSGQNTTSSNIQTQLNTHMADDSRHLTAEQNTFLDGITVDFAQVNALTGLTSYLGTVGTASLVSQLSVIDNGKLNVNGTNSMTGSLNMGGQRIINLAPPTLASDAVNKDYVDSFVQGLHWVGSARTATIQNTVLSGLQTIDGIALVSGDRVLVKNQTAPAQNGIWIAAAGAWSRANDFNLPQEINTSAVFVLEGATQGKSTWIQLSTVTTLNTDPITWSAFSGPVINSAGPGIALGTGGMVSVVQGYGLTFDGNALIADLMPSGGLMHTQDNATASVAPGAQIALTNVGTTGTYRSVSTDAKGRVIAGTNPTTIAGYGLTDAVSKAGDTMTGALGFTGGTTIYAYATAPSSGNTWFRTASYGIGQGDGCTHFGYNGGAGMVNYIRGTLTTIDAGLTVGGAVALNGTATVLGSTIWTQGNLFNVSQLTNNSGYITGASLTWANITGKPSRTDWASTVSLPVVVGQLAWRNYSNGHTIFDASNSLTPTNAACSNTNPDNVWSPTYPTLMGYNGAGTYGVRVDSARVADTATTAGSAGILTGPASTNGSDGWFRSVGQTGWHNSTYNTGIYSTEAGMVRTYNNAGFTAASLASANGITFGTSITGLNYGSGLVGQYSPDKYQAVFSMGDAYRPSLDGASTANSYGILWTHSNVGGQSHPNLGHQMLIMEAGVRKAAIGSGIWTSGAYRGNVTGSSYGSITVAGAANGYNGIYMPDAGGTVVSMLATDGSGGTWHPVKGWHYYWNNTVDCLALGGLTTVAGYRACTNGSHYVQGNIYAQGNIEATGDVTAFSDARFKTNVRTIENAGEKVAALRGITFERIVDGTVGTGVIAQDVMAVLPEAVHTNEDGYMSVAYGNLVGLLIESVKELQAEVRDLKAQINRPRHESS